MRNADIIGGKACVVGVWKSADGDTFCSPKVVLYLARLFIVFRCLAFQNLRSYSIFCCSCNNLLAASSMYGFFASLHDEFPEDLPDNLSESDAFALEINSAPLRITKTAAAFA